MSAGGLLATILGPATSPGALLYTRQKLVHASPHFPSSYNEPSSSISSSLPHRTLRLDNAGVEEELTWWDNRVIWSKGSEVYRQWSFEGRYGNDHGDEEMVSWAGFVWFPPQGASSLSSVSTSTSRLSGGDHSASVKLETFGPFHQSQYATWGGPSSIPSSSSSSSSTSTISPLVRTLLVCLKSKAEVYYPSGEHTTIHLPFPVERGFPLSKAEGGGVVLQRQLEKRELRRMNGPRSMGSVLRGIESGMVSVLDEIVDLEDHEDSLPRLYTLSNPFAELKMVVEGTVLDGKLIGDEVALGSDSTVLFLSDDSYPFVLVYEHGIGEIVFYQRSNIPIVTSEPITARTMRPQDLLAQPPPPPPPPVSAIGRAPRPSMQRTGSTFSTTDRRVSSITADNLTMDRTRRGPRVSRGGVVDPQPPTTSTGELQAALDPPALPNPSSSRMKSKPKRSSVLGGAPETSIDRNQGGGSSFLRDDIDRPVLFGAADRDIRETTMMMGLDKEAGSRSEVILERIWSWKPPNDADIRSANVFLTENISSEHLHINIHLSQTLYTFLAEHTTEWQISPFHFIPCSSAVPLVSTRHAVKDTLILTEGELQLITSSNRSIPVNLPKTLDGRDELPRNFASSLSMVLDDDDSMGSARLSRRITAVIDGVGGRCTVIFDDGDPLRISLDHRIRDDLVRRCVESMSWVIPAEAFFTFKRELAIAFSRLPSAQRGDKKLAWATFVRVLKGLLGLSPNHNETSSSDLVNHGLNSTDPITRRLAARIKKTPGGADQVVTSSSTPAKEFGEKSCAAILLALHLVGQDCRLSSIKSHELQAIVRLVLDLASAAGRKDWWDYWMRLMPSNTSAVTRRPSSTGAMDTSILDDFESPPDILEYLSRRLVTPLKSFPSPHSILLYHTPELGLTRPCAHTTLIISIYDRFAVSPSTPSDSQSRSESLLRRASEAITFMTERGLSQDWIKDVTPGVAIPILEMIRICQLYPQKDWSATTYHFVGRADFATKVSGGIISRDGPEMIEEDVPTIGAIMASVTDEKSKDAHSLPSLPHVRFGSDRRLAEVERILQTTRIRTISVQEPKNASDADIAQYQQSVVNTIAHRTLSLPIGQGIFEYGTRSTTITDTFDIPPIELTVKVVPAKTTLPAQVNPESADWPCFHNGVATALSISPECKGIDSSWIVFNRPNTLNPEHGGFLLGLGLTGHLRTLVTYHAFPYMEPRHDYTSVGLLLGLACSFAGSEDLLITKVLSLHTHALLPLGSMDLNASAIIQSTSLVGLGLVYAGTKNLRMAEVALGEVGRREMAGVDGFVDYQESYSFSAAMAFGLIMLGRGGQITSEVDRRMLAKLTRCIVGSAPSLSSNASSGGNSAIDLTTTSAGATLALGLMYLKTNRRDIADILEIPFSTFALEHVRPDLLLLRTFVRALIMWDDIAPSLAWIESQLPSFINHRGHKKTSQMELNVELAYINIVAGACLAVGLKHAGTATEMAHNNLTFFFGVLSKAAAGQSMTYEGKIRRNAARQGLNVVTIALCCVMSGTGELNVLRRLRVSHGQEGAGVTYGTHMAMHMALGILFLGRGHYSLGTSNLAIATMAIAFFPRFLASTNDNKAYPQAFRHLWAMAVEPRCLVARDVQTGETIYLPVKVKLREAGQVRTQSLISPTLIAPFESILSISVDSPRYWPITYDLSDPKDREVLVRTRTIYVKRRAGFLDYNTDPKGNRSIFVKAGSMTGFDLHYDLISAASPPTVSADEVSQLIATHSGDSHLIAMAEAFKGDTDIEKALRIILLECVSLDKPYILHVYQSLLLAPVNKLEAIRNLTVLRWFYGKVYERDYTLVGSPRGERQSPQIRPNTINALYRRFTDLEPEEDLRKSYLLDGFWQDESLGVWLVKNNVPPITLLQVLREKIQTEKNAGEVTKMRVRDTARIYTEAVAGEYDVDKGRSVLAKPALWKATAVDEAVRVWSGV